MYALYYQPFACSYAVHAALEKIGQPFELHKVNLLTGAQQKEDFLAMNPQGQVPVLQYAGETLTQAGAILLRLSERHPEAALMPEPCSPLRSAALKTLFYVSNTLHPVFSILFYPERTSSSAKDEVKAMALEKIQVQLRYLEGLLKQHTYCTGEQAFAPDYLLLAILNWCRLFHISLSDFPSIKRFVTAMNERAEVKKALMTELQAMAA